MPEKHEPAQILSYGGGRQTIAICVLIARGILPRPDRIVMADTGREKPSTWAYLATHVRPLLVPLGLDVEIAPRSLAYVDLYAHNGDLLIPAYTETGKFRGWCSGEWKRDVCNRYLADGAGYSGTLWIGFALDERRRVTRMLRSERSERFGKRFPLVELMLTTADCVALVKSHGLPGPPISACWMCPNQTNAEWRTLRDSDPESFEKACCLDEELREGDRSHGIYLHGSRTPLRSANFDLTESAEVTRQCGLGMCFV